jgi:acetoacetyl-[acyl-carrier protein] synthase
VARSTWTSALPSGLDPAAQRYALINAKGFGGNNATATLLSPDADRGTAQAAARRARACGLAHTAGAGFDHNVLGDAAVEFAPGEVRIGQARVSLRQSNPFVDGDRDEDNDNDKDNDKDRDPHRK